MTIKSIGPNSADYATMNAAQAGLSGFGTMTDAWTFVVQNAVVQELSSTTWTGSYSGLSAAHTITIEPDYVGSGATGSSNTDCSAAGSNGNWATTSLDYNGTTGKGAGFTDNGSGLIWTFADFMVVQKLQWRGTRSAFGTCFTLQPGTSTGTIFFLRNIVRITGGNAQNGQGSFYVQTSSSQQVVIANNLFVQDDGYNSPLFYSIPGSSETYPIHIIANTFVVVGYTGGAGSGIDSIENYEANDSTRVTEYSQNATYVYDAVVGNAYNGRNLSGNDIGGWNIQNGTAGSGTALPASGGGSTSGVYASDLTNVSNSAYGDSSSCYLGQFDFRPKAAGLLLGFIPSGSRYTGSGVTAGVADTDIRGQTRVGVANDCGCFQATVAAASGFAHSFGAIFG